MSSLLEVLRRTEAEPSWKAVLHASALLSNSGVSRGGNRPVGHGAEATGGGAAMPRSLVCMCVCAHVCVCVNTQVYMRVCECMCAHVCACAFMHKCVCVCVNVCVCAHNCVCMCVWMHVCACTHV